MAISIESADSDTIATLIAQYGCGPVKFSGAEGALYERHLLFDDVIDLKSADARQRFEAIARSVRDVLSQRWIRTEQTYNRENPKRVYYLRIVVLYNRLRETPKLQVHPRTFFFAGKAAPGYRLAKLIIKLINNVAGTIDGDPLMRDRIKVLFVPEYDVSLAERLIPASDVSNQISTAGYEASGTSNMKFMMNGALTIGTHDGATIEMAQEAGEENFFLFGLTAPQVADSRSWYNPHWHYDHEPETRAALDLIFADHFNRNEPGVFDLLRETLLTHGDYYMHLADLRSYLEADGKLVELYADSEGWARKAILNVAGSGKFSSDRTIAEYAADIWNVKPVPIL